ncbi:MAG: right-handed parallel beta-helix repeat-containing protein, partial [Candidatus Marinimicrobia bacterium]|nr:right-handed parallel beta-helix repeat-containing protein [Candidatus Neomarinimicrobiota bacterium]
AGNGRPNPAGSNPDLGAYESVYSETPYPDAPYDLMATPLHKAVELNWHFPAADDVVKYYVYQNTDSTAALPWSPPVDTVMGRFVTRSTITGLTNETMYYYYVNAIDTVDYESQPSEIVSTKPYYKGPVWWVATNGSDTNNDGSENNPFLTIDNGIQMASAGDTVMVKAGTYQGNGNRGLDPGGVNMVIISESGAATTILDAQTNDRHFMINSSEDNAMQIVGFTFMNGSVNDHGGSMFIDGNGTDPTIKDCIFRNNETESLGWTGGAINVNNCEPIFENCTIEENSTIGYGGGIAVYGGFAAPTFDNCTIINNETSTESGSWDAAYGAGVYIQNGAPVFTDCIIDSNTVTGGGNDSYGGGIFIGEYDNNGLDPVQFIRCFIRENEVNTAGTFEANGGAMVIRARAELINCVISGNSTNPVNGVSHGGAIAIDLQTYFQHGEVKIINCTIADNDANAPAAQSNSYGGALYLDWDEELVMFNTVIWGNTAEVDPIISDNGANMTTNYNNIEDGEQFNWFENNSHEFDPMFTDASNGDYSLSNASFNIGAGSSSFSGNNAPSNDILGNDRPGSGGGNPDIGAYENSLAVSPYPAQVANLVGTSAHQQVILNWDANPESDISHYIVYQSTTQDFVPASTDSIGRVTHDTTTFTATGLINKITYYYRVSAVDNDSYEGSASFEVAVIPRYTGPVWYVDDISTNGEGSFKDPFNRIQIAIDSAKANTDTVMVLSGTYTGSSNRDLNTWGKNLVIKATDGAEVILDAEDWDRHFTFYSGEDTTCKIIGFTLRNGKSNDGGSIYIDNASPQIVNCTFSANTADNNGGAVYVNNSMSVFKVCNFDSNTVASQGQGSAGAVFIANFNNLSGPPLLFDRCQFTGNQVNAFQSASGGALNIHARADFINCLFAGNEANAGVSSTGWESSYGGGIYLAVSIWNGTQNVSGTVRFINCTLADNSAGFSQSGESMGGGIYCSGWPEQKITMFNSIIWGNSENVSDNGADIIADYNDVQNGTALPWFVDDNSVIIDPCFTDADNDDYSLSDGSPLIGIGAITFQGNTAPTVDILGNGRPDPSGSIPDLGAYENALASTPYPDPPKNLIATPKDQSVNLSWGLPDSADVVRYYVYMGSDSVTLSPADTIEGRTNTSATIAGLTNEQKYYFHVTSEDDDAQAHESMPSNMVSAIPEYMGPVWYVDAENGSSFGEGSSGDPLREIQDAIDMAVEGDTVLVRPGIYDRSDDQEITFYRQDMAGPKNIVLMSSAGADSTVIDGEGTHRLFDISHGTDTTLQIIGFTIISGGENDGYGSAIRIDWQSSVIFKNCIIENSTANGTGIMLGNNAMGRFIDCTIRGSSNLASDQWQTVQGGAFYVHGNSKLVLNRCRVLNNEAVATDGNAEGGAIYMDGSGENELLLINSIIADNRASSSSNAEEGSALFVSWGKVEIVNSTITDNEGGRAANIYGGSLVMFNSIIAANDPANQQLWIDDYDVNYVTSNCILEFMIDQPWFGDECLDVDPMFADTTYVLSGRSLAIGSGAASIEDLEGVDIFAPVVDIGGNPRPNPVGSNPDLGAYENALASTPYPDPPKNLTVEELHHTVALSWTASDSTDVTQYIVYMGTDSTVIDPVDTVLAAVTTDTISGLTNQTEYFFAVSSLDTDTLESLFSEIIPAVPEYRGPVWYVDDISTNGEGSFEEPANNIRDMIEISADGDTILLMPGTYNHYKNRNLDFQYNNPGSTRNLIVTSEKGPDSTIIDINNEGLFLLVYNGESLGSELIGLTFQNGSEGVVHISDDSQLMVKNCVFRNNNSNNGGAIELFSAGNLRARRVLFESNSASCSGGAIDLGHGTADIKNSIFYDNYAGCEGGAITLNDDQSSLQIIHSLFLENSAESGPGGVMRYSPNAYMGIFNSIFWDNTQNPSFSNDINDASIVDHCILQEGSPVWNLGENYFYDPMIVDPTANDFSLSEYSGAIGRGLETYFNHFTVQDETVPVRDYLNNDRPQPEGTLPDIGPIEHEREVQKYFVYQVSITGNDLTGDGLTFPFKTIGRGIMEANEFDTVEVGSGTYLGMGNRDLDFGGLPLVLRSSDGPDTTIIDCEQQGRAFEFSSNEGEEAIVQGFTIRNGDFPDGGGAVYLEDSSPSFVNMIFENNVAPNGPGGAVAANNSYSQFINCVFRDNHSQAGGAVYSLGGDLGFNHCTIVGNGAMDQAAITVEDGYLLVENSILWYNHPDPPEIATVGTGVAEVRHSNIMGGYDGDNNYNGRPCFEDGPNGDFHLEDWSLAIGWADTSSFVDFDIEGNIRSVSDTTWPDIGAFENTLAAPDTTVYTSVDWYVSTTGLDTDPGTQGLPFATLQRAADYGIWNDNVILLAGTYDQDMDTWGKDLIIRGDGTVYETVVTGRLSIKRGESPRISNLKFSGSVVSIDIAANSAPELSYLEFTGGSGATVLQSVHSMPILDHVTFADNTGDAILAADTSFVQVANSIFWNTGDHYSLVGGSTISIDYSRTDSSGTGNIVDEPDFQAVGDYQLMAYSLLVNAGDPTVVDDDGTITDIGVYPYLTDHTGPDWYVDATLGNDLNGTGSSDIPFASVQGGINFALTNDTVWISEGTYLGTANLRDYDIVLSGAGDGTIIDGDGLGPVLRIGDGFTSNTVVRDLIITGAPTDKVAIRIDASSPNLQNLWLKGNDGGVYIDGGNPTIEYCLITDNTGDGIIVDAVTIGSLAVVNNTIAGNGGTGIINNSTATVEVRNTILSANTGGSNSGTITATYSDVTGAGLMTDGNIDTDPLFVDAANGDYELQLLSPCVDTGDSTDTFDPDSTVRDMGALPLFRTFVGGNTDGNNVVVSGDTTIIVNTDLTIDENDSLIIEPGGTLYLGDGVLLTIDGTLDAFGLPGVPIRFQCLYPGDRFGGIKLPGGTTNRTDPVYSYLLVTDVDPDSIPVTVSGNASLEHVTIAGNGNPISLQVTNGGTVILNYSILEGETLGTIDSTGSFVNNPTAHFVDPDSVFELLPTSSAIDVGVAEAATNIDPDFTYSDAGAFYHDQSAYATNTATVLYPALGDTVNVSPDTSATVGLTVTAQMLNEFGNFKTNALINWTPGVNGSLLSATTDTTDLEGSWSNTFFTSTVAGDLNSFTVTSDGASGVSGSFQVVPGVPDSLFAAAHDSILTQLDTLTLAVSVFDQFDNLVSDGETVNWTVVPVTAGFVLESAATTTVNGVANVDLMTDPNTELAVGNVVRVQAESNGVTVLSETITIVPDDIYNLSMPESLTAAPIPLSADVASITITATMIDTFDNLLEGVDVSWLITAESSSDGALSNSITPTNAAGLAVVDLTTGTVTGYEYWVEAWINEQALVAALGRQANADAIRVAGIVTTTGKKGSVSTRQIILPVNIGQPVFPDNWDREAIYDLNDTTNVIRIIPGVSAALAIDLTTDTVLTQLEALPIAVTVTDQFGNLVADDTVVDWTIEGAVTTGFALDQNTTVTTDGIATNILSTDPTAALGTTVTVKAQSGAAFISSSNVVIVTDNPYNLAVDDAYERTPVADANIVPLALTIIDTFENVLDAVPVYWSIIEGSGGSLINGQELDTTLTDVDGIATNTLTTSTLSGSEYRVRIWVENVGGYTFSRSIGGESVFKALPAASTGKMAFSAMPETALSALSAGSRTDFQLDDTTDVITVLAGAPVTITPEVMDTTYVVQGQTDSIEIEVTDQFGNLVSDDSAVNWNASTPANYNIDEQDNVTTDGKAELVLTANSDAPWLSQIDFDIVVTSVFDANHADKHLTYIVQDVIAPAAVTDLAITPAVWTPTNSFDLTWTNPTEHSGVAGAHYVIDMNTYYYQAGQGISSVADIALFDNGISTIGVWLEDNAANEDIANIDSLVAKWDNVAPDNFSLVFPSGGSWLMIADPVIEWGSSADGTAGLRYYRVVLDGTDYQVDPAVDTLAAPVSLTETSHTLTVFAVDSAYNETEMTGGQISFDVDFTLPEITHNQTLEGSVNSAVAITASFADPASGIARAELYYRKGGEMTWQSPVDMRTLNTYQIAGSFVTSVGMEYYLEAEDVAGNIRRKPAAGFYSIEISVASPGLSSTKIWPTGVPNGTSVSSYQLVSFPGTAANNTPTDILVNQQASNWGAYDNTKWKFFTYGAGDWIEFASITAINPGVGYFLIVKDAGKNISTGLTRSVETDQPFSISLPAGDWKFLGNPFDFDIPLPNVYDQDSVSMQGNANFYTWDGEWKAATRLDPWRGYIYKSASGGTLYINPRKANGGMAKILDNNIASLQDGEWLIDITAQNGYARDLRNRVGVLHRAQDTYDPLDSFEPPVLPGGVSLRIDNRDWPTNSDIYTTDIKSVNPEGSFWDMEVVASDVKYNVYLNFAGLEDLPEDYDIFLIDKSIGTAQNLRGRPDYYYAIGSANSTRKLRLVAGTEDFVNANNAGVALYPESYSLSQNFPNPFNPKTTILVSIEDDALVDLVIYNLLGEVVTTLARDEYLPAGYYNYIWAGKNDQGRRVASGIYFYASRIKSPSGKVLLNSTKKMILVK